MWKRGRVRVKGECVGARYAGSGAARTDDDWEMWWQQQNDAYHWDTVCLKSRLISNKPLRLHWAIWILCWVPPGSSLCPVYARDCRGTSFHFYASNSIKTRHNSSGGSMVSPFEAWHALSPCAEQRRASRKLTLPLLHYRLRPRGRNQWIRTAQKVLRTF